MGSPRFSEQNRAIKKEKKYARKLKYIVNHLASKSRKEKMKISKRTNAVELLMSV
ncbi:hypothetical protein LEP1GSC171_0239 [Leptospira santarosai str. HAI1380]|nr:hypothetical protein LEP1GSC171_0239 [Leptospira santarosai str. HAI1380]